MKDENGQIEPFSILPVGLEPTLHISETGF